MVRSSSMIANRFCVALYAKGLFRMLKRVAIGKTALRHE